MLIFSLSLWSKNNFSWLVPLTILIYETNNDYSNLPLYKSNYEQNKLESGGNLFSQPSEKISEPNLREREKDSLRNFSFVIFQFTNFIKDK